MKTIVTSRGHEILVDDADYEWLTKFTWHVSKSASCEYVCHFSGPRSHQTKHYMHREILNTPPGMEGHHKNGNPLDNRRENLENIDAKIHGNNCFKGAHHAKNSTKPNGAGVPEVCGVL